MMTELAKLTINNLHIYSYHGVTAEEQQLGGRYEIDVEVYYTASTAIASDDLSNAVNYAELIECIGEIVHARRRKLIETLANDIATAILDRFAKVESVCLRVRKRTVPVSAVVDSVEVEWHKHRR